MRHNQRHLLRYGIWVDGVRPVQPAADPLIRTSARPPALALRLDRQKCFCCVGSVRRLPRGSRRSSLLGRLAPTALAKTKPTLRRPKPDRRSTRTLGLSSCRPQSAGTDSVRGPDAHLATKTDAPYGSDKGESDGDGLLPVTPFPRDRYQLPWLDDRHGDEGSPGNHPPRPPEEGRASGCRLVQHLHAETPRALARRLRRPGRDVRRRRLPNPRSSRSPTFARRVAEAFWVSKTGQHLAEVDPDHPRDPVRADRVDADRRHHRAPRARPEGSPRTAHKSLIDNALFFFFQIRQRVITEPRRGDAPQSPSPGNTWCSISGGIVEHRESLRHPFSLFSARNFFFCF